MSRRDRTCIALPHDTAIASRRSPIARSPETLPPIGAIRDPDLDHP
jgi:hypothetical protein